MKQYIKIFCGSYVHEVEEDIQEFLEDHNNELQILHTTSTVDDGTYILAITYTDENVSVKNNDKI